VDVERDASLFTTLLGHQVAIGLRQAGSSFVFNQHKPRHAAGATHQRKQQHVRARRGGGGGGGGGAAAAGAGGEKKTQGKNAHHE
jgi:hypothetical protein